MAKLRYPDSVSGLSSQLEHSIALIIAHLPQKSTTFHVWNIIGVIDAVSFISNIKKFEFGSKCILGINNIILHNIIAINRALPQNFLIFPRKLVQKQKCINHRHLKDLKKKRKKKPCVSCTLYAKKNIWRKSNDHVLNFNQNAFQSYPLGRC